MSETGPFGREQSDIFLAYVHIYEACALMSRVLTANKALAIKYPDGRFTKIGREVASAKGHLDNIVDRMYPKESTLTQSDFLNYMSKMSSERIVEIVNLHFETSAKNEEVKS